jgi:hypothetical protein
MLEGVGRLLGGLLGRSEEWRDRERWRCAGLVKKGREDGGANGGHEMRLLKP